MFARGAIAVAVCLIKRRGGDYETPPEYEQIPCNIIRPTQARAQLAAINLALQVALERQGSLRNAPNMEVKIYTDSIFAYKCMTEWKARWVRDDFASSQTGPLIDHRDLLRVGYDLQEELEELVYRGSLEFVLMGRGQNVAARSEVEWALDGLQFG